MSTISAGDTVVLDIEGTVTPVAFVHEVLFPYAHQALEPFLRANRDNPKVLACVEQCAKDVGSASFAAWCPHAWPEDAAVQWVVAVMREWMAQDAKRTGLKALQGLIWASGYADGRLKAPLYADVVSALRAWHEMGVRLAIYSSGSIPAQKLLFTHTSEGDLTPLFAHYFDTTSGSKREAASYTTIAASLDSAPERIVFFSDLPAELDAAQAAGWRTVLVVRPGNAPVAECAHPKVTSLLD
jgi:enolase-phosphatase E1